MKPNINIRKTSKYKIHHTKPNSDIIYSKSNDNRKSILYLIFLLSIFIISSLPKSNQLIIPNTQNPIIMKKPYKSLTDTTTTTTIIMNFSFQHTIPLQAYQYIGVVFPNTIKNKPTNIDFNSNENPIHTCLLTDSNLKQYKIKATLSHRFSIYSDSNENNNEKNIIYCQYLSSSELNIKLDYSLVININKQLDLFFYSSIGLFTSSSNTPSKILFDYLPNFGSLGIYNSDYYNFIEIISVESVCGVFSYNKNEFSTSSSTTNNNDTNYKIVSDYQTTLTSGSIINKQNKETTTTTSTTTNTTNTTNNCLIYLNENFTLKLKIQFIKNFNYLNQNLILSLNESQSLSSSSPNIIFPDRNISIYSPNLPDLQLEKLENNKYILKNINKNIIKNETLVFFLTGIYIPFRYFNSNIYLSFSTLFINTYSILPPVLVSLSKEYISSPSFSDTSTQVVLVSNKQEMYENSIYTVKFNISFEGFFRDYISDSYVRNKEKDNASTNSNSSNANYNNPIFFVIKHINKNKSLNKLNFIASTCEFSSYQETNTDSAKTKIEINNEYKTINQNEENIQYIENRPLCYPLNSTGSYKYETNKSDFSSMSDNKATSNGSGFYFKLDKLKPYKKYLITIMVFTEKCGNTSEINVTNSYSKEYNDVNQVGFSFIISAYSSFIRNSFDETKFSEILFSKNLELDVKCFSTDIHSSKSLFDFHEDYKNVSFYNDSDYAVNGGKWFDKKLLKEITYFNIKDSQKIKCKRNNSVYDLDIDYSSLSSDKEYTERDYSSESYISDFNNNAGNSNISNDGSCFNYSGLNMNYDCLVSDNIDIENYYILDNVFNNSKDDNSMSNLILNFNLNNMIEPGKSGVSYLPLPVYYDSTSNKYYMQSGKLSLYINSEFVSLKKNSDKCLLTWGTSTTTQNVINKSAQRKNSAEFTLKQSPSNPTLSSTTDVTSYYPSNNYIFRTDSTNEVSKFSVEGSYFNYFSDITELNNNENNEANDSSNNTSLEIFLNIDCVYFNIQREYLSQAKSIFSKFIIELGFEPVSNVIPEVNSISDYDSNTNILTNRLLRFINFSSQPGIFMNKTTVTSKKDFFDLGTTEGVYWYYSYNINVNEPAACLLEINKKKLASITDFRSKTISLIFFLYNIRLIDYNIHDSYDDQTEDFRIKNIISQSNSKSSNNSENKLNSNRYSHYTTYQYSPKYPTTGVKDFKVLRSEPIISIDSKLYKAIDFNSINTNNGNFNNNNNPLINNNDSTGLSNNTFFSNIKHIETKVTLTNSSTTSTTFSNYYENNYFLYLETILISEKTESKKIYDYEKEDEALYDSSASPFSSQRTYIPFYCPYSLNTSLLSSDTSTTGTTSANSDNDLAKKSATRSFFIGGSFKTYFSSYKKFSQFISDTNSKITFSISKKHSNYQTPVIYNSTLKWNSYSNQSGHPDAYMYVFNGSLNDINNNITCNAFIFFVNKEIRTYLYSGNVFTISYPSTQGIITSNEMSYNTKTSAYYFSGFEFGKAFYYSIQDETSISNDAYGNSKPYSLPEISELYTYGILRPFISDLTSDNNYTLRNKIAFFCVSSNERSNNLLKNYIYNGGNSSSIDNETESYFLLDFSYDTSLWTMNSTNLGITIKNDNGGIVNFQPLINTSLSRNSVLKFTSLYFTSATYCFMQLPSTEEIAECEMSYSNNYIANCPLNNYVLKQDYESDISFDICCYSVSFSNKIVSLLSLVNYNSLSATEKSYFLETVIKPPTYSGSNPYFKLTLSDYDNQVNLNSIIPVITTLKYTQVIQFGGLGKMHLIIDLKRYVIPDMLILISGDFSESFLTADAICYCSFYYDFSSINNINSFDFSENSDSGHKDSNGISYKEADKLIKNCDLGNMKKSSNEITITTGKIITTCSNTPLVKASQLIVSIYPVKLINQNDSFSKKKFKIKLVSLSSTSVFLSDTQDSNFTINKYYADSNNNITNNLSFTEQKAYSPPIGGWVNESELCNVTSIFPGIVNEMNDYYFNFIITNDSVKTEITSSVNEVTIYFSMKHFNLFSDALECFFIDNAQINSSTETTKDNIDSEYSGYSSIRKRLICEIQNDGFINIKIPKINSTGKTNNDSLSSGFIDNFIILLSGIVFPEISQDITFFCSINSYNALTDMRMNIINGFGYYHIDMNVDYNIYNILYYNVDMKNSYDENDNEDDIILFNNNKHYSYEPRDSINLSLYLKPELNDELPFVIENESYVIIYFPYSLDDNLNTNTLNNLGDLEVNISIVDLSNYYLNTSSSDSPTNISANEENTSSDSFNSNSGNVDNTETISISLLNKISNRLDIKTTSAMIMTSSTQVIKITLRNLPSFNDTLLLTKPISVCIKASPLISSTTSTYKLLKTITNLNNSHLFSYTNFKSKTKYLQYVKGLTFSFQKPKWIIDLKPTQKTKNDIKLTVNYLKKSDINYIKILPGRYFSFYFQLRNEYRTKNFTHAITRINFSDETFITKKDYYTIYTLGIKEQTVLLGCKCDTNHGTYFLRSISITNTEMFYDFPVIKVFLLNSKKGRVYLYNDYYLTNQIVKTFTTPSASSAFLFYKLSEPSVDELYVKWIKGSEDNDASSILYSSVITDDYFYTEFVSKNSNASQSQFFLSSTTNSCYSIDIELLEVKLSGTIITATGLNLASNFYFHNPDSDSFGYINNESSGSLEEYNSLTFYFTPPVIPIKFYCSLTCYGLDFTSDSLLTSIDYKANTTNTGKEWLYLNQFTSVGQYKIKFDNLIRGEYYKLKCIAQSMHSVSKTTTSAIFETFTNFNDSYYVPIKTKIQESSFCFQAWFTKELENNVSKNLVKTCQEVFITYGFDDNGCIVCTDSEGNLFEGFDLESDNSCPTVLFSNKNHSYIDHIIVTNENFTNSLTESINYGVIKNTTDLGNLNSTNTNSTNTTYYYETYTSQNELILENLFEYKICGIQTDTCASNVHKNSKDYKQLFSLFAEQAKQMLINDSVVKETLRRIIIIVDEEKPSMSSLIIINFEQINNVLQFFVRSDYSLKCYYMIDIASREVYPSFSEMKYCANEKLLCGYYYAFINWRYVNIVVEDLYVNYRYYLYQACENDVPKAQYGSDVVITHNFSIYEDGYFEAVVSESSKTDTTVGLPGGNSESQGSEADNTTNIGENNSINRNNSVYMYLLNWFAFGFLIIIHIF